MYRGKPMPKCDFNKVALALNEKYLKAKIKSYSGKINTNVHNNKIPKRGSQFFCLSVILIYSVFITGKIYYPQVFVERYQHLTEKDIKILLKNKSRKYLSIDRFQKSLKQLGIFRKVSNTITVGWKPTKCGSVQQK